MKKVLFRADASSTIGYGHFIRSLALADMLKDDFDCTFFTVSPSEYQIKEMRGICKYVELKEETKLEDFLAYLTGEEIIVLDNYFFTTDYQREIKAKGCKLVCIDDLHDKHYVADIVINHGVTDYTLFDTEPYTKLCLGLDWALLRAPFLKPITKRKRNNDIVVCFGGADPYRITDKIVSILLNSNINETITVILGNSTQLNQEFYSKINVAKNLTASEMAILFDQAKFGIFSSSGISIEAISRGLPIISGYYIDNQRGLYQTLLKKENVVGVGDLKELSEQTLLKTIKLLTESASEKNSKDSNRRNFVEIKKNYIALFKELHTITLLQQDFKQGCLHFVNYINCSLQLHKEILELRNSEPIRRWMASQEHISEESHLKFIEILKNRRDRCYFAVLKDNVLMGTINLSYESLEIWERGLFTSPAAQGSGFTLKMEKALAQRCKKLGIHHFTAKVISTNIRSVKYHLKAGYKECGKDNEYLYFIKRL